MFCKNCGNQMSDSARFCTRCGTIVGGDTQSSIVNEQPVTNPQMTEGKKKGGFKIVLILGIFIVLLLAVILAVVLVPKLTDKDRTQKNGKDTVFSEHGNKRYWDEYEEDDDGNQTVGIKYDDEDEVAEWFEWEYDEDGNLLKEICYLAEDIIDYWYEYDADGNKVKERKYTYLDDEIISGWRESDEEGNLIKEAKYTYHEDESLNTLEEYDDKGNRTKEIIYDGEENISVWTEWEYDENGRVIALRSLAPDGSVGGQIEYVYDSEGRKTKEVVKNGTGYIDTWKEWEYDGNGNMLKEERYNNDAILIEWDIYKYDDNGNCIEKIYYNADGTIAEWYSWEYDVEGHKIKEIVHHLDGSPDIGYEYDTDGNQTRVIDYDMEQLVSEDETEETTTTGATTNKQQTTTTGNTGNNGNTANKTTAGIPDAYYKILDEIYDALLNNNKEIIEMHPGLDEGVMWMNSAEQRLKEYGYSIMDTNKDGKEELLIGYADSDGGGVLEMYSDRVCVFAGWSRSSYTLLNDGTIFYQGSGGAAEQTKALYGYDGHNLICKEYYYSQDEGTYLPEINMTTYIGENIKFYYSLDGEEDHYYPNGVKDVEITEEEYLSKLDYYEEYAAKEMNIKFTAFESFR